MFAAPLTVCKHLFRQRYFRLMCTSFNQRHNIDAPNFLEVANESRFAPDYTRLGITFTTKYLNELPDTKNINWDDLTNQLKNLHIENPSAKILQACIRLDKIDIGINYFNYLTERGVKLSDLDLIFFSKLLLMRKSEIKKHEKLIINLYENIKEFIATSPVIRGFILEVFVEIPHCFFDIVKQNRRVETNVGNMPLVKKALELNMPDVAFDFVKDIDFPISSDFVESYLTFCIKKVEDGSFTIDLINKLIDICADKGAVLNHEKIIVPLKALVSALNKHQDVYSWSVSQCQVDVKSVCSNCGLSLLPRSITPEEFNKLKNYFFDKMFGEKIFLKTTEKELQHFLTFLKHSRPYNVVIDGLNLIFRNKHIGTETKNRHLKYFLDKGFKVLTIGRLHSKATLMKGNFLSQEKYKNNFQFYFTSNMSDDDLFLLYATLHGGLNTYFVTGDHCGTHLSRLDNDMKTLFLRWQFSHQYLVKPDLNLIPPAPHCGFSQLTHSSSQKYIWHLSQQKVQKKIILRTPLYWYCLKAEKKLKRKEDEESRC